MKSFRAAFCDDEQGYFMRKVFWLCLRPRARLVAVCLGGSGAPFFRPDRVLLARVSEVTHLRQLDEELDEFIDHPDNHGFLRRNLRIRISTTRLRRLAQDYLPMAPAGSSQPPRERPGGSGPPFGGGY